MQLIANILFGLGMLAVSLLLITSGLFLTHAYYISPEGAHWMFSFTAPAFILQGYGMVAVWVLQIRGNI